MCVLFCQWIIDESTYYFLLHTKWSWASEWSSDFKLIIWHFTYTYSWPKLCWLRLNIMKLRKQVRFNCVEHLCMIFWFNTLTHMSLLEDFNYRYGRSSSGCKDSEVNAQSIKIYDMNNAISRKKIIQTFNEIETIF